MPAHPDALALYRKLFKLEGSNIRTFHELISDRVVELSVQELLNGVDLVL